MLTDEEKQRIKSEEIYRDEIRKKLNENEQISKFWKFVNSSFGIWLLSTVVVGLIVYLYNDSKLQNEISANNAATIQKLETEASNRLQQFKLALSNQQASKIYYQKEDLVYMIDGDLVKNGTLSSEKPIYIFPEYKERTMNSLLYEIERLSVDKKSISNILEARKLLTDIQSSLLKMEDEPRPEFLLNPQIQRILQIAQIQPDNLTQSDRKILSEYKEKEKDFEQKELAEYRKRVKNKLNELLISFKNNEYLNEMSEK